MKRQRKTENELKSSICHRARGYGALIDLPGGQVCASRGAMPGLSEKSEPNRHFVPSKGPCPLRSLARSIPHRIRGSDTSDISDTGFI